MKCGPDVSIIAGPLSKAECILPLLKVLLGSKRQARTFLDINILVILVSKQFATFLHIYSNDKLLIDSVDVVCIIFAPFKKYPLGVGMQEQQDIDMNL